MRLEILLFRLPPLFPLRRWEMPPSSASSSASDMDMSAAVGVVDVEDEVVVADEIVDLLADADPI